MPQVEQLSIFQNIPLEKALDCMVRLDFAEAIFHLSTAKKQGLDIRITEASLEACLFWQSNLKRVSSVNAAPEEVQQLIEKIASYPFIAQLKKLKEELISRAFEIILSGKAVPAEDGLIFFFDLLLKEAENKKAKELILYYLEMLPQNKPFLYLLAQSEWRNREKIAANRHYTEALLFSPGHRFRDRIENPKLQTLISNFGAAEAPSYAWITGISTFVKIPDTSSENEGEGLKYYRLLKDAENARKQKRKRLIIETRKKFQTEAPALYQAYFKTL